MNSTPNSIYGRFACMMAMLTASYLAQAAPQTEAPGKYMEGQLLLKFKDGPKGVAARDAKAAMRHEVIRDFEFVGWQHVRLPAGMSITEALARYKALPNVLAAEPNYLYQAVTSDSIGTPEEAGSVSVAPNDPLFGDQWPLAKISASNTWNVTTGSTNVVVAVLDSGVNYSHEDLSANMWRNPGEIPGNGIDDDGDGYVDDVYGIDVVAPDSDPLDGTRINGIYHGTACAGVIGAVGNNNIGITGVNWSVQIMALRFLGPADEYTAAGVIECFDYIIRMKRNGVNIKATSNSYGTTSNLSPAIYDALAAVGNENIVNVFLAGNNSANSDVSPVYPGNYPDPSFIVVAATDRSDNLASFSNYGRTNVDLAAPGQDIVLLAGPATNSYYPAPGRSGTSYSCPHVAGAVALLAAAFPQASAADLKAAILSGVDLVPALTNKVVSNGRLNIDKAMQFIRPKPPLIISQPENQRTVLGSNATFAVGAVAGLAPLQYHWQADGADVPNGTNAMLALKNVTTNDAGNYRVVVSNYLGSVTSSVATLVVLTGPVIDAQPQNQSVIETSNAVFRVVAAGVAPLTSQWQPEGAGRFSGPHHVLTISNASPAPDGRYGVMVANGYGSATSSVATLTVLLRPRITAPTAPLRLTAVAGETVTLGVETSGALPIGYRWRQIRTNGTSIIFTNLLLNQNVCLLTFTAATNSAGTYALSLTNVAQPSSSVLITNAILSIVADGDGDGISDEWEIAHGLNPSDAADGLLDPDGDGVSNAQEYIAGTDPNNPLSVLRIESIRGDNDFLSVLRFDAISNRTYSIQFRPGIDQGTWITVSNVTAVATNRIVEIRDAAVSPANPQRFYRLITPVAH